MQLQTNQQMQSEGTPLQPPQPYNPNQVTPSEQTRLVYVQVPPNHQVVQQQVIQHPQPVRVMQPINTTNVVTTATITETTKPDYLNPPPTDVSCRRFSTALGGVAILILASALGADELAAGEPCMENGGCLIGETWECGWDEFRFTDQNGYERTNSYKEMGWDDDEKAALYALTSMIWGFIWVICGIVWVQTFIKAKRFCCACCDFHCPRILFILAAVCCFSSVINWTMYQEHCMDFLQLDIGASMILSVIAGFVAIAAAVFAK